MDCHALVSIKGVCVICSVFHGSQCIGENATSGTRALARLNELRYRLVDRGVKAIALQPKWCVLRPGECDLDS